MVTNEELHAFSSQRRSTNFSRVDRSTLRSSIPISHHDRLRLHNFTIRLHPIILCPIMCLSPLLGGFKRRQPEAPPPDYPETSEPPLYESPRKGHDYAQTASTFVSSGLNICVESHLLVPHGLGRGIWNHKQIIHFSHFLSEDPSLAVFSNTQNAPVPTGWGKKRGWWRYATHGNWREVRIVATLPHPPSSYTNKACLCKLSNKTPVHWNPSAGILLVNWMDLQGDSAKWDAQMRAQEYEKSLDADEKTLVTVSGVSADLKLGSTDEKKE
jgi:hypothetical protein